MRPMAKRSSEKPSVARPARGAAGKPAPRENPPKAASKQPEKEQDRGRGSGGDGPSQKHEAPPAPVSVPNLATASQSHEPLLKPRQSSAAQPPVREVPREPMAPPAARQPAH